MIMEVMIMRMVMLIKMMILGIIIIVIIQMDEYLNIKINSINNDGDGE